MKIKMLLLYFLAAPFLICATPPPQEKCRILVGSPVRQKPAILTEFLASLNRVEDKSFSVDYYFVDDNVDETSSQLLNEFSIEKGDCCHIINAPLISIDYICDESGHNWSIPLMDKVGAFKDQIIWHARKYDYDYLFFIDSDIVLHPKTIENLISKKKDIISNIFWTSWSQETIFLPQVWIQDQYTQIENLEGAQLSQEEVNRRHTTFLTKMNTPGTYEVGGLGACTLISKEALEKGVCFKKLKNCSFWGEDRHFCLRAAALDIGLFVDTHYPSYHIYRESALSGVEAYVKSCNLTRSSDYQRITLSMIMRNEADNKLREVLEKAKAYIDSAVIIDDASTDESVSICEEVLAEIPHKIIKNKVSKFENEIELRTQQWEETIKINPDWILFLDADEIFEDKFAENVHTILKTPGVDVYSFRLYDFWDEAHYREDQYWCAHQAYRPFLVRYRPDVPHGWLHKTPQHCGRMPTSCTQLITCCSPYRVKHYGWESEKVRRRKHQRYMRLDPEAKYGIREQYDSILDPNPTLIEWVE